MLHCKGALVSLALLVLLVLCLQQHHVRPEEVLRIIISCCVTHCDFYSYSHIADFSFVVSQNHKVESRFRICECNFHNKEERNYRVLIQSITHSNSPTHTQTHSRYSTHPHNSFRDTQHRPKQIAIKLLCPTTRNRINQMLKVNVNCHIRKSPLSSLTLPISIRLTHQF